MSEWAFIADLTERLAKLSSHHHLLIPPGDDTALVKSHGPYLFAADMLMEGVHFDLATTPPELVGRKALAVNLSDVAAMAGTPVSATVALALPKQRGLALGRAMMDGIVILAEDFDVAIAGGDTNAWDGPAVLSVAITGAPHPRGSLTRAGAKVGDVICVTGALGNSLDSGRHLTFTPRVREARSLRDRFALTSMIDLSDGLATDLGHVLKASGVGAVLDAAAIPCHLDLRDEPHRLDRALSDGEDFELCFTAPPAVAEQILATANLNVSVTAIGRITTGPQLTWSDGRPITTRGFEHELKS